MTNTFTSTNMKYNNSYMNLLKYFCTYVDILYLDTWMSRGISDSLIRKV